MKLLVAFAVGAVVAINVLESIVEFSVGVVTVAIVIGLVLTLAKLA